MQSSVATFLQFILKWFNHFHLSSFHAAFCKVLVFADSHGAPQRAKGCVSCKIDKIQVRWQEYFIGDTDSSCVALTDWISNLGNILKGWMFG